jgi:hypothetical protein
VRWHIGGDETEASDQLLQVGIGEEPYEKEHTPICDPYQCKL